MAGFIEQRFVRVLSASISSTVFCKWKASGLIQYVVFFIISNPVPILQVRIGDVRA